MILPIIGVSAQEKADREQRPVVVRFDLLDRTWTRVTGYKHPSFSDTIKWQAEDVSWGSSTDEVVVTYTEPGSPAETFRYVNSDWALTEEARKSKNVSEAGGPVAFRQLAQVTQPPDQS